MAKRQQAAGSDPELTQHVQAFADLLAQLKDVVGKLDPSALAYKPGPEASA